MFDARPRDRCVSAGSCRRRRALARRRGGGRTPRSRRLRARAAVRRAGRAPASSSRPSTVGPADAPDSHRSWHRRPAARLAGRPGRRCSERRARRAGRTPRRPRRQPRSPGARHDGADAADDRRELGRARLLASMAPALASRSSIRASPPGTTISAPIASCISPTSSTSSRALRRLRPRHARRRHHRRQRLRFERRAPRHRAGRQSRRRSRCSTATATASSATSSPRSTTPSQHGTHFNIRVINLSVAAGVYESFNTDPLTLAAKRAVEAGIVVVAAAGNLGRNAERSSRSTAASPPRAMRRGC